MGLGLVFVTALLLPWMVAGYLVFAVVGATAVERSFWPRGDGPVGHWRRGAGLGVQGCILQWLLFCLLAPLLATDVALVVPLLLIGAGAVGFALPVVGRRQSPRPHHRDGA